MQSAYQQRAQGLGKNIWIPEAHDFQTITGESKKGSGRNPASVFLIFKHPTADFRHQRAQNQPHIRHRRLGNMA